MRRNHKTTGKTKQKKSTARVAQLWLHRSVKSRTFLFALTVNVLALQHSCSSTAYVTTQNHNSTSFEHNVRAIPEIRQTITHAIEITVYGSAFFSKIKSEPTVSMNKHETSAVPDAVHVRRDGYACYQWSKELSACQTWWLCLLSVEQSTQCMLDVMVMLAISGAKNSVHVRRDGYACYQWSKELSAPAGFLFENTNSAHIVWENRPRHDGLWVMSGGHRTSCFHDLPPLLCCRFYSFHTATSAPASDHKHKRQWTSYRPGCVPPN